jgi:FkbM family methyltransferase
MALSLQSGARQLRFPCFQMDNVISYSQWGEDRLVWEYFGRKPRGFFAEIGANDPQTGSQTFLLEQNGWEGLLVEPQPDCCKRLRALRPKSKVIQAACGAPGQRGTADFHVASADSRSSLKKDTRDKSVQFTGVSKVEVMTLNEILEQAGSPALDFLSIDVEGAELEVLQGLDLRRHRPALIVVEDYVFTLKVHRHLAGSGYKIVKRTGSNNWYVPRDQRFPFNDWKERLRLFRKLYLGTPLRKIKLRLTSKVL